MTRRLPPHFIKAAMFSLIVCPPLGPLLSSLAYARPPSSVSVQEWLEVNQGTQRFTVDSGLGIKGESLFKVNLIDQRIEVIDELNVYAHGRQAADSYELTRKRYQATPPYALVSAELYRVQAGEAHVGAWRARQEGSPEGEWREGPAPVIRRAERRGAYEELSLAAQLWRPGRSGHPLSSAETILSALGSQLIPLDQALNVTSLGWGKDERFSLSLLDRRLVSERGGTWRELVEVKVVDPEGRVSRQLKLSTGRLLRASVSDQLSFTLAQHRLNELRPLSELIQAHGVLPEEELQAVMRPARDALSECSRRHNPHREALTTLMLRLNLNQGGALGAVGFEGLTRWGPFERCVAQEVTALRFSKPRGGEALIRYPLRFTPMR